MQILKYSFTNILLSNSIRIGAPSHLPRPSLLEFLSPTHPLQEGITRQRTARPGPDRTGPTRHGTARHGTARPGPNRPGPTCIQEGQLMGCQVLLAGTHRAFTSLHRPAGPIRLHLRLAQTLSGPQARHPDSRPQPALARHGPVHVDSDKSRLARVSPPVTHFNVPSPQRGTQQ